MCPFNALAGIFAGNIFFREHIKKYPERALPAPNSKYREAMSSWVALFSFHAVPLNQENKIMKISKQDVERVAALARLELSEEEIERLTPQLDHILSYVTKLDELDTEGVPVTTHTQSVTNAFREDEVRDSLPREKALANTARENGEAFVVPKVVN